ncbi:hypothetical protein JCM30237_01660 [Halolamina litorea]|uniref:Uncharacterized protein n=1 Tax=Halolamina litorea TaxID=1515593 RepID=A0ABD6BRT8_9EURY|nr:hypothetical protein [Halolamina litorea]
MNLYRTSESGLVAVQPLEPGETEGLAGALLRGPGGELGAEDVFFVTSKVGDGTATALALDAAGTAVVLGAADGEVGSGVVTDALQRASAVADRGYDELDAEFDGEGLREAHADYFGREPLAPGSFNDDQRVRLLGGRFADDALDLAAFLSDRELSVDPVHVEAFGDPTSGEFLVRFEGDDDTDDGVETAADGTGTEQWVAGASAASTADDHETPAASEPADTDEGGDGDAGSKEAATADDEPIELPELLSAVADGVSERLVGTFETDPGDLVSVERGNELLVRPDESAYAGGVLRYRLRVESDGTVGFEVNIYGGSEAEKERMRALIRENEGAIETELGYEVSPTYDGFEAVHQFDTFDRGTVAAVVDEFDRLVRFFHPRVSRA